MAQDSTSSTTSSTATARPPAAPFQWTPLLSAHLCGRHPAKLFMLLFNQEIRNTSNISISRSWSASFGNVHSGNQSMRISKCFGNGVVCTCTLSLGVGTKLRYLEHPHQQNYSWENSARAQFQNSKTSHKTESLGLKMVGRSPYQLLFLSFISITITLAQVRFLSHYQRNSVRSNTKWIKFADDVLKRVLFLDKKRQNWCTEKGVVSETIVILWVHLRKLSWFLKVQIRCTNP